MTDEVEVEELADFELATKVGQAMLNVAIEMIGEADGEDFDHCNLLLCMALGVALKIGSRIDEKIGLVAAQVLTKELENERAARH
jgi:hypothetical protein